MNNWTLKLAALSLLSLPVGCGSTSDSPTVASVEGDSMSVNQLFDSLGLESENFIMRAKVTVHDGDANDEPESFVVTLESAKLNSNNDASEIELANGPMDLDIAEPIDLFGALDLEDGTVISDSKLRLFLSGGETMTLPSGDYNVKWPSMANSGLKVKFLDDAECVVADNTLVDLDIQAIKTGSGKINIKPVVTATCLDGDMDVPSDGDDSNNDGGGDDGSGGGSDGGTDGDTDGNGECDPGFLRGEDGNCYDQNA